MLVLSHLPKHNVLPHKPLAVVCRTAAYAWLHYANANIRKKVYITIVRPRFWCIFFNRGGIVTVRFFQNGAVCAGFSAAGCRFLDKNSVARNAKY